MDTSLNQTIEDLPLPAPQNGEDLAAWGRRCALIGAHVGAAHALTHRPPTVVRLPIEQPTEQVDEQAGAESHEF